LLVANVIDHEFWIALILHEQFKDCVVLDILAYLFDLFEL